MAYSNNPQNTASNRTQITNSPAFTTVSPSGDPSGLASNLQVSSLAITNEATKASNAAAHGQLQVDEFFTGTPDLNTGRAQYVTNWSSSTEDPRSAGAWDNI